MLLFDLVKVTKEQGFVRRRALRTLRFSAFVEVFYELFVLNFFIELVLAPVFATLGGMSVVAAQKAEHRAIKRVIDTLIAVGSAGLFLHVVVSLLSDRRSVDPTDLLQQFALPIWLTIGVLPYVYFLGLYAGYERALIGIDGTRLHRARVLSVLATSFHVQARELGSFSGSWRYKLNEVQSFRAGRRVVAEFRESQRNAERVAREKAERLVRGCPVARRS